MKKPNYEGTRVHTGPILTPGAMQPPTIGHVNRSFYLLTMIR